MNVKKVCIKLLLKCSVQLFHKFLSSQCFQLFRTLFIRIEMYKLQLGKTRHKIIIYILYIKRYCVCVCTLKQYAVTKFERAKKIKIIS